MVCVRVHGAYVAMLDVRKSCDVQSVQSAPRFLPQLLLAEDGNVALSNFGVKNPDGEDPESRGGIVQGWEADLHLHTGRQRHSASSCLASGWCDVLRVHEVVRHSNDLDGAKLTVLRRVDDVPGLWHPH